MNFAPYSHFQRQTIIVVRARLVGGAHNWAPKTKPSQNNTQKHPIYILRMCVCSCTEYIESKRIHPKEEDEESSSTLELEAVISLINQQQPTNEQQQQGTTRTRTNLRTAVADDDGGPVGGGGGGGGNGFDVPMLWTPVGVGVLQLIRISLGGAELDSGAARDALMGPILLVTEFKPLPPPSPPQGTGRGRGGSLGLLPVPVLGGSMAWERGRGLYGFAAPCSRAANLSEDGDGEEPNSGWCSGCALFTTGLVVRDAFLRFGHGNNIMIRLGPSNSFAPSLYGWWWWWWLLLLLLLQGFAWSNLCKLDEIGLLVRCFLHSFLHSFACLLAWSRWVGQLGSTKTRTSSDLL